MSTLSILSPFSSSPGIVKTSQNSFASISIERTVRKSNTMPRQWPASLPFDALDAGGSSALLLHLVGIFPDARRKSNIFTGWSSINHYILCTVLKRKSLMKRPNRYETLKEEAGKVQRRYDLVRPEGTEWEQLQEELDFPCHGIWHLLRNASPATFPSPSCSVPNKQEQLRPELSSWSSQPSWAISNDCDHDYVQWWLFILEVMAVTAKYLLLCKEMQDQNDNMTETRGSIEQTESFWGKVKILICPCLASRTEVASSKNNDTTVGSKNTEKNDSNSIYGYNIARGQQPGSGKQANYRKTSMDGGSS